MKTVLLFFLMLCMGVASQATIITLPKTPDGGLYKPKHNAQPGDTILLQGDYSYIFLENITGENNKPIVIMNEGLVRTGLKGNYGLIVLGECFIINGQADERFKYGIQVNGDTKYIAQGVGLANSTDYEIMGVEIQKAQVGFFAAPPTGNIMKNIKIHDCYIHDLDNPAAQGRTEAFYLGNTSLSSYTAPAHFENLEIYNNICENISGDGIQVAMAQRVKIHHNVIKNYGKASLSYHQIGILLGGCSNGEIYDNNIMDGSGTAIQVFGSGLVSIRNNKIERTSTALDQDAIYINQKCADGPPLKVTLIDNVIDKASRELIKDVSGSVVLNKGNKLGTVVKAVKQ